jgi:HSP20 family molecular chaperone IbpA
MRGGQMSWDDEFDLIRSYVKRRMRELERELESAFNFMYTFPLGAPPYGPSLDEPLHEIYLTDKECVVIIDVPLLDQTSITVEAEEGKLRIEGRTRRTIKANEIGYRLMEREISRYYKELSIPVECNVSEMSYSFRNGRIIIRMPKIEKT